MATKGFPVRLDTFTPSLPYHKMGRDQDEGWGDVREAGRDSPRQGEPWGALRHPYRFSLVSYLQAPRWLVHSRDIDRWPDSPLSGLDLDQSATSTWTESVWLSGIWREGTEWDTRIMDFVLYFSF